MGSFFFLIRIDLTNQSLPPFCICAYIRMTGLIPLAAEGIEEVYREVGEYTAAVAIPPYFGETLPEIPVANFHNAYMEPNALPLQYVRIPVDGYIPRIYTDTSFKNQDDLPSLYRRTSNFFSGLNGTTIVGETTTSFDFDDGSLVDDLDDSNNDNTESSAASFHSIIVTSFVLDVLTAVIGTTLFMLL